MKIGFDLDNVILDTFSSFLKYHNKTHETRFLLDDIRDYHIWEVGIGRTKDESMIYMDDFFDSVENIPFVKDAEKSMLKIMDENEVYFITSRFGSHRPSATKLIMDNYPDLINNLIFSGDFLGNGKSKAEICQELGIELYVEDHYDFLLPFEEKGIKSMLLKYPWNEVYWNRLRKSNLSKNGLIVPVKNWNEILEEIENAS